MDRWIDTFFRPWMYAASDMLFMYVDPFIGKKLGAKLDAVSEDKQKQFFETRHTPEIEAPYCIGSDIGGPMNNLIAKRPIQLPYKFNHAPDAGHAPAGVLTTESLREFGELVWACANESKRKLDEILTP